MANVKICDVGTTDADFRINYKELTTIRRPHRAQAPQKEGPRANREITASQVQLIDAEGANRGSIDVEQALELAYEAGFSSKATFYRYFRARQGITPKAYRSKA